MWITPFQMEVADRGLDMFFTQADTFGKLKEIYRAEDMNTLNEPEDIIEELKELWWEVI